MANEEMDALLARNLRNVNAAYDRLVNFVEPRVRKEIDRRTTAVADERGWEGEINYADWELWFSPPEWLVPDAEDPDAEPGYLAQVRLATNPEESDEEPGGDFLFLAKLCDEGRDNFGIWLKRDYELAVKRAKWAKIVMGHEAVRDLVALGYAYDEASADFFRPVRLSGTALATSITEADFDPFMEPLDLALKELPQAIAAYQRIIDTVVAVTSPR